MGGAETAIVAGAGAGAGAGAEHRSKEFSGTEARGKDGQVGGRGYVI